LHSIQVHTKQIIKTSPKPSEPIKILVTRLYNVLPKAGLTNQNLLIGEFSSRFNFWTIKIKQSASTRDSMFSIKNNQYYCQTSRKRNQLKPKKTTHFLHKPLEVPKECYREPLPSPKRALNTEIMKANQGRRCQILKIA